MHGVCLDAAADILTFLHSYMLTDIDPAAQVLALWISVVEAMMIHVTYDATNLGMHAVHAATYVRTIIA